MGRSPTDSSSLALRGCRVTHPQNPCHVLLGSLPPGLDPLRGGLTLTPPTVREGVSCGLGKGFPPAPTCRVLADWNFRAHGLAAAGVPLSPPRCLTGVFPGWMVARGPIMSPKLPTCCVQFTRDWELGGLRGRQMGERRLRDEAGAVEPRTASPQTEGSAQMEERQTREAGEHSRRARLRNLLALRPGRYPNA